MTANGKIPVHGRQDQLRLSFEDEINAQDSLSDGKSGRSFLSCSAVTSYGHAGSLKGGKLLLMIFIWVEFLKYKVGFTI